jgi:hypothetical protein
MTNYPVVVFSIKSSCFHLVGSIPIETVDVPKFSLEEFLIENRFFPKLVKHSLTGTLCVIRHGLEVPFRAWDEWGACLLDIGSCEEALKGFYRGAWGFVNIDSRPEFSFELSLRTKFLEFSVALVHDDSSYIRKCMSWDYTLKEAPEKRSLNSWELVPYDFKPLL